MTRDERTEKILADLADRELDIGGFVVVDRNTHKLMFITYDNRGLIKDISRPENAITIYGKDDPEYRVMHEIMTLSATKPAPTDKDDG